MQYRTLVSGVWMFDSKPSTTRGPKAELGMEAAVLSYQS